MSIKLTYDVLELSEFLFISLIKLFVYRAGSSNHIFPLSTTLPFPRLRHALCHIFPNYLHSRIPFSSSISFYYRFSCLLTRPIYRISRFPSKYSYVQPT